MFSMTKVVLNEVDRLAFEKVRGHRVSHAVHVPSIEREIGERRVAGEECLYPALREPALSADEESRVVVGSGQRRVDFLR